MMARSGRFLMDFIIFRVVGGWPWELLFGGVADDEGSSALWRWKVGFKEKEVTVRRSRRWDRALLAEDGDGMKEWASNGDKVDKDEAGIIKDRLMPAITPAWVKGKTGYLMMDKSWDLDFGSMITAHNLIDELGLEVSFETFRTQVLIYEHGKGWLVWPVWQLEKQQGGRQELQRQKIVQMKDRLTTMGKENLFFRWVEMIQFESSAEGGFTLERQQHAVRKAKELFEAQGIDFEQFWKKVDGGMEGMMGMEVVK